MNLPLFSTCRHCKYYDGTVCTEKTGHPSTSYIGLFVKPDKPACCLFIPRNKKS